MADLFDYLRQFNLLSVVVRLLAAMLFGGMLGIDRAKKGRAAGFRTAAVCDPSEPAQEEMRRLAEYYIQSFEELTAVR